MDTKHKYITEFIPIELIIAYDVMDLPETYIQLLKKSKDENILEEIGKSEIRIIHWEWFHNKEYHLIIDITCNPDTFEYGIICINDTIIFENDNQELIKPKGLITNSPLVSRIKSFEYLRKLDATQEHDEHYSYVLGLINDLKTELLEENVCEDEFVEIVTQPYVHYSSDDASDIDKSDSDTEVSSLDS